MKQPWWKDGLRFQCQQSGKCCVSHGEYGFVYLTLADRQNIARALKAHRTDLDQALREGGYLTRDARMVERKKPGRKKARKSFQFSKR